MNKRRILAVLIAFVLTVAATAMWSASTIQREGDPDAIVLEDSGTEAGNAERFEASGVTRIEDANNKPVKRDSTLSSAKEHLEAGREYLLEGNYNEAISELSTATSLD